MTGLATIPKGPQGLKSYIGMSKLETALSRARAEKREIATEQRSPSKMIETSVATLCGAALCGGLASRGWSDGSIGAIGGALAVAGVFMGQPTLVHAANGCLAPFVASLVADALSKSGETRQGAIGSGGPSNVTKLRSAAEQG